MFSFKLLGAGWFTLFNFLGEWHSSSNALIHNKVQLTVKRSLSASTKVGEVGSLRLLFHHKGSWKKLSNFRFLNALVLLLLNHLTSHFKNTVKKVLLVYE